MAEMNEPPDAPDADLLESLTQLLTARPPREPGWILEQLGLPPLSAETVPAEPPPRISHEEIEEMMQDLLRGELKRFGLLDADGNLLPSFQIPE